MRGRARRRLYAKLLVTDPDRHRGHVIKRAEEPGDVISGVSFLTTDEASFITGQTRHDASLTPVHGVVVSAGRSPRGRDGLPRGPRGSRARKSLQRAATRDRPPSRCITRSVCSATVTSRPPHFRLAHLCCPLADATAHSQGQHALFRPTYHPREWRQARTPAAGSAVAFDGRGADLAKPIPRHLTVTQ